MSAGAKPHDPLSPPNPGAFEMVRREPRAELTGVVTGIFGYREIIVGHHRQCQAASLDIPIIINFGTPFAIALGRIPDDGDHYGTFAAGLSDRPVVIDSFGAAKCLQINFTPLGARHVFGLPMSELAHRLAPLDDVLGSQAGPLRDRVGELNDWGSRFDLVESFVLARLRERRPPSPQVTWAYGRLMDSHGATRIGAIASKLDWSRKHLAAKFRDEIGLSPKRVARVIRFNRALGVARNDADSGWADIAADCGYADQAHLTREFAELAGASPAAWRAPVVISR